MCNPDSSDGGIADGDHVTGDEARPVGVTDIPVQFVREVEVYWMVLGCCAASGVGRDAAGAGGTVSQRRMRAPHVVVPAPLFNDDLRFL